MRYQLNVNGRKESVDVAPDTPLLWVLRESLGLTGTKYSCGIAQCGACTVHLGGRPMRSCVMPISRVGSREVVTIEGLSGSVAAGVQQAWNDLDVPQCGYCQSGQIMTAVALLRSIPEPSSDQINDAMVGNICRCAAYERIRAAIQQAAGGGEG
jgi:isoquinoline 1-oxidoreductase alpha subunit